MAEASLQGLSGSLKSRVSTSEFRGFKVDRRGLGLGV